MGVGDGRGCTWAGYLTPKREILAEAVCKYQDLLKGF